MPDWMYAAATGGWVMVGALAGVAGAIWGPRVARRVAGRTRGCGRAGARRGR